jgi:hypothetical protein
MARPVAESGVRQPLTLSAPDHVATGNGYADPPQNTTDAVMALDLATAK